MRAAIVAVGSELLHAGRRDTNGDWLAERLGRLGIPVRARVLVEDDPDAIEAHVRVAMERCDLVLVTGGLGPTEDDRSRGAVAAALGVPLERDVAVVEALRRRFESRGRRFEEHQARQADRPRGSRWLENPAGTAAGFLAEHDGRSVACLPGVPAEMRTMYEAELEPWLLGRGRGELARRTYKVSGRFESSVDRRVADLYTRPGVTLTILAGVRWIELHAVVTGSDPAEADARLEALDARIREQLGDDLFGIDDETLAEVVGRALRAHARTVATAESCTAGLLAAALTSVPGSSAWFKGGLVLYDDALKVRLGGVEASVIESHGAVSREVAVALAAGARDRCGADVGVGLTGVAGPGGGTADKPVGLVHLAMEDAVGTFHESFRFPGDRRAVRARTVAWALDRMRRRYPAR